METILDNNRALFWENTRLALSLPFRMDQVKWRAQQGPWEQKDGSYLCLCIPYIDARHVQGRLDRVVGPGNWSLDYKQVGSDTFAGLGVLDPYTGQWVWKWDTGHKDMAAEWGAKGTASDAQKRAAVQWGVGRYLYGMRKLKLACTVRETKDGPRIRQVTGRAKPADFPSWAVSPDEWDAWESATGLTVPVKVRAALLGEVRGEPEDLADPDPAPQEQEEGSQEDGHPALTCAKCGEPIKAYIDKPTGQTYTTDSLVMVSKAQGRPGPWCGYCHFHQPRPTEEPTQDIAQADFWLWVSRSYCRAANIDWQDPDQKRALVQKLEPLAESGMGYRAVQNALLEELSR